MTTFIDTSQCARVKLEDPRGEVAEIVNKDLCGAEDVTAMLRWLKTGECLEAEGLTGTHQLIYLMEGNGVINLEGKDYDVPKGGGIYLGPGETATVAHAGSGTLKLLHLVVPIADH
ncbi:MAG: AraC family ligand binding domain-containing protein [bacterium]